MSSLRATDAPPVTSPGPAPVEGPPPLEAEGIVKRWRKDLPPILDGVDLRIEAGRRVWVGGRNGVGKTTLLRILSGLIYPGSGTVRAFGLHPARDRRAYQMCVHFMSAGMAGLYARMTVREQIDCWARIAFVPRAARAATVEAAVEDFGLRDLADQRSDRLSMGQRQRLKLAMTFVGRPDLVLLDEPRNSLDAEGAEILKRAVDSTAERGGAVLWCSPTLETTDVDFDELYVLEDGRLRAE
jgi:ABC-type multidrug transport system ATPase subunit